MTTEQTTTEATTTGGDPPPPTTMLEAAQQAAEIDPPPKKFRQRLTVQLSDRELVEIGRKYSDAEQELQNFDDETKEIALERKATRAEIDGRRKKFREIFRVGREDRDVECVENVSIRQGRKWRVRLDTNQTYAEEPLSDSERQASLPMKLANPDDKEDGQLELATTAEGEVAEGEKVEAPEVDEPAEGDGATEVNDPDALLEAAQKGEQGEPEEDVDESDTEEA